MSEAVIWNYLKSQGLSDYGVAGLMGNLYAESGLNPKNLQNSYEKSLKYTDDTYTAAVDSGKYKNFVRDSAGYGLAQWTYWSRKQALLDHCKSVGASIGDLNAQLEFLIKELTNGYGGVLSTLRNASSILEASNAVLLNYERPADQSVAMQNRRASYGQGFYDKFAGTGQKGGVAVSAVEHLLNIARAEIGYLEKATNAQLDDKTANAGSNNWTKYARDLDKLGVYNFPKNGYAWCDMFADWCYIKAFGVEAAWKMTNQPMGGCGAGCAFSAQYYKDMGRFYTKNPQPGDQIFFRYNGGDMDHTGIVEKVEGGKVYTIEGNTSSAQGVVPNGGGVNRKEYPLTYSKIGGYGRPDWSVVEGTIFEEDDDMDVNRFKELWLEMRKELQDNDASEYSREAREWAVANGIVAGGSTGEFNGMWEDVLTREQMVALLYRFAKMIGRA